jgi:hypothetical protein
MLAIAVLTVRQSVDCEPAVGRQALAVCFPTSLGDRSQSGLTTLLLGDSFVYGGHKNLQRATDFETDPVEPEHLITQIRLHMARLRPVPAARHAFRATFVHNDLHKRRLP